MNKPTWTCEYCGTKYETAAGYTGCVNMHVEEGRAPGELRRPTPKVDTSALARQEGGRHYADMKIQPVEFIHANGIPFIEGCVIKYVSRWRAKGGVEDLKKARHFIDLLLDLEAKK